MLLIAQEADRASFAPRILHPFYKRIVGEISRLDLLTRRVGQIGRNSFVNYFRPNSIFLHEPGKGVYDGRHEQTGVREAPIPPVTSPLDGRLRRKCAVRIGDFSRSLSNGAPWKAHFPIRNDTPGQEPAR